MVSFVAAVAFMTATLMGCGKPYAAPQAAQPAPAVAQKEYSLLYGLSGFKFADLAGPYAAKVMVVDVDDAKLTAPQVKQLRDKGQVVFSYLSIGEAENYRSYWQGWDKNKPAFLLGENKNWKGNFRVKFWDKNWQNIILAKAAKIAQMGFNGVYLDIVDGYQEPAVIKAYPGSKQQLRQEMENFVIRISNQLKQINPQFKIIPQNAVELVASAEDETKANLNYLRAIDGMGIEDLWYVDDEIADWTEGDLSFIRLAQIQGKFILSTSYPTDPKKQADFLNKALKAGLIPFVGKRSLSKKEGVYPVNKQIPAALPKTVLQRVY